jgi:ferrochelatase|tara:strand:+ start:4266 stop:5282 length:1017 start_codon:yes stop_codon:yes gene_type:complete
MPVEENKIGLLLVNLGTPEGIDYWSIRRYLAEFLSDRRVVELPALIWQPILQGIVLSLRPRKSSQAYAKIWNREKNESPLKTLTRAQAQKLGDYFHQTHPQVLVDWGMRYGQPALADRISALQQRGCQRILLFPLYPQYCGATTATVNDQAYRQLMTLRYQPTLRSAPAYFDQAIYISTLKAALQEDLAALDWTPDVVLASLHGMPKVTEEKGDPYARQCQTTVTLLRQALNWEESQLQLVFQSRFGAQTWLQPYAASKVAALAAAGTKKLAIFCPGFASDCVETLEEVALGLQEIFRRAGGEQFAYLPCLNDRDLHIEMLAKLAEKELAGWIEPPRG